MSAELEQKLLDERQKNTNDKFEVVDRRLGIHDDQISKVNEAVIKLTVIVETLTNESKKTFWDSDGGKKLLTALIIAGLILLAGGVGTNVVEKVNNLKIEQKAVQTK